MRKIANLSLLTLAIYSSTVFSQENCPRPDTRVEINKDTQLNPKCVYAGILIQQSNIELDCRGAHVKHQDKLDYGVLISSPESKILKDVTVKNCKISGFLNNIRVTRKNRIALSKRIDQEYVHTTSNIKIDNVETYKSRGSNIFIDAFVSDVTIKNSIIRNGGGAGIYLEAGSRENKIIENRISENGFAKRIEKQKVFGISFKFPATGREGIAVDGSRLNIIKDNRIHDNSAGGVFLYKNCGEFFNEEPHQWWQRNYGANGNKIIANTFEKENVAIWVASRMSQNQKFLDCSDKAQVSGFLKVVHQDQSINNFINQNVIKGAIYAIRVEDSSNTVVNNVIELEDYAKGGIVVGTRYRGRRYGKAISNIILQGNRSYGDRPSFGAFHNIFAIGSIQENDNVFNGRNTKLKKAISPLFAFHLFLKADWFDQIEKGPDPWEID